MLFGTMAAYLDVEPVRPDEESRGTVFIDSHAMAHEALDVGDAIEIQTQSQRSAIAKIGEPLDEDHDTNFIRLDENLRSTLKTSIGDTVEVSEAEVDEIGSVTFAPLSDVSGLDSEELAGYLTETFLQGGRPLNVDAIEYVSLPGANDATGFKVLEAEPSGGILTEDSTVEVEFVFSTWGERGVTTFEDIGGLTDELREMRELIEFPIRFPDVYQRVGINPARGVILHGPPGTGKTMMTRAISNELDANFHYINGPSIVSTTYGQTEEKLRDIFNDARQSLPSIVFIDEIDAIAPKREETGALADLRMVAQLLELMDGLNTTEGVMVVATTNRINAIDPALRRPGRFDREVYIGPPDVEGRKEILDVHTRGMLIDEDVPDFLPELSQDLNGYTGADIKELTREAGVSALRRQFGDDWEHVDRQQVSVSDLVVNVEDFKNALKTVQPSVLRAVTGSSSNVTFDDVAGLEEAKQRLRELVEIPREKPDVVDQMNLDTYPGILLSGPAGTGKTLLAQAAGNEFNSTFIQVESSEIFSQWVGQSEEALKQVFRNARRASPSVVLIDNLDAIAGTRSEEGGGDVANRVINQLLMELEKIRAIDDVTVLATTNRPELIDDSLLSANRFGEVISIPLPDERDRRQILTHHLANAPSDLRGEDLDVIVDATEGKTGADLAALVRNSKFAALRDTDYESVGRIQVRHLETALRQPGQAEQ